MVNEVTQRCKYLKVLVLDVWSEVKLKINCYSLQVLHLHIQQLTP
jgi:hypothetical protein